MSADVATLRVTRMSWESAGVVSVVLRRPDGAELPPWAAGAHIDVILPNGIERQYSLCGDPSDRFCWRIAVLREEVSRGGSKYVHTRLRLGDEIRVRGPRNNFGLGEHERYVFVAGGIGITPLLPMISEAERRGADWSLVYGGRLRASMAFVDELSEYGDRVTLWPQDERGRIDLLATVDPGCAVYCCGPEPLLAALEKHCAGWDHGSLHLERFAPKPTDPDGRSTAFDVVLTATGRTVSIPADCSILEALEAEGIYPPASCTEGVCGTCETKVLAGVPDHRDSILTDDERAAGEVMMICVSRSATTRLELDL